jgi:hypothetical protein
MRQKRTARGGSQIAELAPALLILFIVVLFPMLDVMYLGMGYCAGWYLNHITSRGCSTVAPPSKTAPSFYPPATVANLNNAWLASSFQSFTGASIVSNTAETQLTGVPDPSSNNNNLTTMVVVAKTQVRIQPFFTLPSMPLMSSLQIDGLTRPITFQYVDRTPLEENGLN